MYFEFGNEASASPHVWKFSPYTFYFCVDGLVTDDDSNVNVVTPTEIVEQSVDGDRGTALASLGGIIEDVEHSRSRPIV